MTRMGKGGEAAVAVDSKADRRLEGWPFPVVIVAVGIVLATALRVDAQSSWFAGWSERGTQPMTPRPAVVRVIAEDADGQSQGSGTLVAVGDRHGLVITNWHVVRDATGRIRVVFPDGFESAAQVLKTDQDWDLAALGIWRPRVAPVPIAHVPPVPGEPLTIAGYGPGRYREATGRLTQYVAPAPQLPYEMFEIDVEARNGDSGGPIFNARGELAGVLFGAAQGTTAGSYCGRVRLFVDSVIPLIDGRVSQVAAAPPTEPRRSDPAPSANSIGASRDPGPPPSRPAAELARLPESQPQATIPAPPMEPVALPRHPVASVRSQPPAPSPSERPPRREVPRPTSVRLVSALRVLGETPLEQIKTFLAIVGVVAIVMQLGGRRREA